ncbi:hypothetical protein EfmJHP36_04900 [Enterococcus faecium]|nr:hypothetical protein EfmJHP36_04900 [Enterococcus faecium]
MKIKAALFDLASNSDYRQFDNWYKKLVLANQLSIPFTEKENEQLKGISRTESL